MASSGLKKRLYENEVTISDIAREAGVDPRNAGVAIQRWEGKTGNPRGKTREILKSVEREVGAPIYQEAS